MIDISVYIEKLELLRSRIPAYLDQLCFAYNWHLRIITDIKIPLPNNYKWIGHDPNIELSELKYPNGWSKPDFEFEGVQVRYLWKQFKPEKI